MLSSQIPTKIDVVWASGAAGGNVRTVPDTTSDPNAASFTLGWPPNVLKSISAGGSPPDGRDDNGINQQITAWLQWQSMGIFNPYDSAFASAIGGYPKGAILAAIVAGYFWLNLADNNTINPDTVGTNWQSFSLQSPFTTGDAKITMKTTADPGWLLMNDTTFGSATSGATTASNLTQSLFTLLYNNVTDTYAPILTSGGGATTRGAQGSAAAAWAANCRMTLPLVLGRALCGAGNGTGLPAKALGQNSGAATVALSTGNLPPIFVSANENVIVGGGGADAVNAGGSNVGSSTPFSVEQPSSYWNVMIKL